ncbi:MAG: hypothetical protein AAGG72_03720, partial [Pseudomonadota bacterium]
MAAGGGGAEPTMDEILASIRKRIQDDPGAAESSPETRPDGQQTAAAEEASEPMSGLGPLADGGPLKPRLADALQKLSDPPAPTNGDQITANESSLASSVIDDDLADLLDESVAPVNGPIPGPEVQADASLEPEGPSSGTQSFETAADQPKPSPLIPATARPISLADSAKAADEGDITATLAPAETAALSSDTALGSEAADSADQADAASASSLLHRLTGLSGTSRDAPPSGDVARDNDGAQASNSGAWGGFGAFSPASNPPENLRPQSTGQEPEHLPVTADRDATAGNSLSAGPVLSASADAADGTEDRTDDMSGFSLSNVRPGAERASHGRTEPPLGHANGAQSAALSKVEAR